MAYVRNPVEQLAWGWFKRGVLAAGLTMISLQSNAAVPKHLGSSTRKSSTSTQSTAVPLGMTRSALGLPLTNRLQVLQAQGPDGYRNLVAIMFDEKNAMDTRWRAVTAAGRIGGELSKPELERALKSREWYMRNAGLVAMLNVDRAQASHWAKALLSDKALVVRAAAVDALVAVRDASSAPLLWEKLYSRENYKGKQSLFIRRRIVEALAQMETSRNVGKFIEVLADNDETLHVPAIRALERITHQSLGEAKEPLNAKRAQWKRWWEENRATM